MAFRKQTYNEEAKIATVDPIRSKRDIKKICDWFYEHDLAKYAVLFKFGCYTGLRASDILGFKKKDLYKQTYVSLREQKTGKVKRFPLQPLLQTLLNNYIEKLNITDEDYVFGGRGNKEVDRSQVYRFINRACEELGIEANVGTHTMRKTFGYFHYKQFNDIACLQKIFNHTSPDVTLRYIGVTQDQMDDTYLKLDLEGEDEPITMDEIALKGNNRTRIKAVLSFCSNYLKYAVNGIHRPFVEIIIDLIKNTSEYQY